MGVGLEEMVHIGDRDHNDVKGPQKLGMKAILFTATRAGRQGPHQRRRDLRAPCRSAGDHRPAGGRLTARRMPWPALPASPPFAIAISRSIFRLFLATWDRHAVQAMALAWQIYEMTGILSSSASSA